MFNFIIVINKFCGVHAIIKKWIKILTSIVHYDKRCIQK